MGLREYVLVCLGYIYLDLAFSQFTYNQEDF